MNKDLRKIAKALQDQGFEVTETSRGHLEVRKDGRRVATLSGTPSDHRSWLNGIAQLRRAAFRWRR